MEYSGLDIENILKKYGLTQDRLAEMMGVSRKTIINYKKTGKVTKTKWELLDRLIKELEAINGNPDESSPANSYEVMDVLMQAERDFEDKKITEPEFHQKIKDIRQEPSVKYMIDLLNLPQEK